MPDPFPDIGEFLRSVHPYDSLPAETIDRVSGSFQNVDVSQGDSIYTIGEPLPGVFLVRSGAVEIRDAHGAQVSLLGPRNSFGERGLNRDGNAATTAVATENTRLLVLPTVVYRDLTDTNPIVAEFFNRGRRSEPRAPNLTTIQVSELISGPPVTCAETMPIQEAAQLMRSRSISCLPVTDADRLTGIVTTKDISNRAVAEALDIAQPIATIMTPDPVTLPPSALGSDVLHIMHERRIGHLPITDGDTVLGLVTQTDLTRLQAVTSALFVRDIARAETAEALARVTKQIPQLLVQLVGAGNRHEVVTRLITDIADAATRRLLALAEKKLGPPPVPYAWLACGSQGRREQTGVSDQDNCLFLDDSVTDVQMGYFEDLARFVCDGLNTCGYVYCPGDMMATNPRWRQPVRVWRDYFRGWIDTPNPEAQMLASVMFDLRTIGGKADLFDALQSETLAMASGNSIFVAHMVSNSLKHTPPLGMIRGFATIRSGEHKNHIDLKHNGVVPVVDLARLYALRGQFTAANTRARLDAATRSGELSASGGEDLMDAYDLIAQTRLEHQSRQIRKGEAPDNFLAPGSLSDFERSHLRNAFVVVRTMQSAIGHGRGLLS